MPETVDIPKRVSPVHAVVLTIASLLQLVFFDAAAQPVRPVSDTIVTRVSGTEVGLTRDDVIRADYQTIRADASSGKSRLAVVNMWATWCAPCIEEFPDFIQLARRYDSTVVRVLFVSVDFEEQLPEVREFLTKQGWERVSYFKNQKDDEFVNGFSQTWTGAVPATFVFNADGDLLWFVEGKTTFSTLNSVIESNVE